MINVDFINCLLLKDKKCFFHIVYCDCARALLKPFVVMQILYAFIVKRIYTFSELVG